MSGRLICSPFLAMMLRLRDEEVYVPAIVRGSGGVRLPSAVNGYELPQQCFSFFPLPQRQGLFRSLPFRFIFCLKITPPVDTSGNSRKFSADNFRSARRP